MPVQSFALASAALSVLGAHVGAAEMSLKTEFAGNTFFNGFYYNASASASLHLTLRCPMRLS